MAFEETESIFETRKAEINDFYKYLQQLTNDDGVENRSTNNANVILVLKSSILLMFYNLIESVVTSCVEELNKIISDSVNASSRKNKYFAMENAIRSIWADNVIKEWQVKCNAKKSNKHSKTSDAQNLFDSFFEIQLKPSDFGNSRMITASGDLDARRIRELFSLRGIELHISSTCQQERLEFIKIKRNQLAHGGESFYECSRDISPNEIDAYKTATFQFLSCTLKSVRQYCDDQKFILKSTKNEYPYI